jgi:hypothetical protein
VLLPESRFGYFLSCNADNSKLRETVFGQILDRYFPKAKTEEAPVPPKDFNERAARYTGYYRNNRYARYTLEKLSTLANQLEITADGMGHLVLGGSRGDSKTLVEIEPELFQDVDRGVRVAFRTDAAGAVTNLVTASGAFDKLPWYETAPVQFSYIAGLMLVFLSAGVGWPLGIISRPWRRRTRPGPGMAARLARFAAWLVVSANAGLILFLVHTLMTVDDSEFIVGVPQRIVNALYIPLATAPGAAVLFLLCCAAWRRKWWGLLGRLHYTGVALAALGFVPFLWYWNLLGFRW